MQIGTGSTRRQGVHREWLAGFGRALSLFFVVWGLAGCAGHRGDGQQEGLFSWFHGLKPEETNEAELANEAMDRFRKGQYRASEERFEKVRSRYPFSPYATLAELRLADCKYYQGDYVEAVPLYEEFEKLHPTNEAVPYCIFQIGSCHYRLMASPDRDQSSTHKLIEAYERLIKRFPESPFTYEAGRRIAEAKERLADSEIFVARWYLRTGQRAQARYRCEAVVARYPETEGRRQAERIIADLDGSVAERVSAPAAPPWWRRLVSFP